MPRLLEWLRAESPDVICLQETKVVDELFPFAELEAAGYRVLAAGQKTYNGVAILSLQDPTGTLRDLPGSDPAMGKRFLSATVGGIRIVCLYAPNGREVGHAMYAAKLEWFSHLLSWLEKTTSPSEPIVLCGDFNITPEDKDIWDPDLWRDRILCSIPEREALAKLQKWGLTDTLRLHRQDTGLFSWWDFQGGAFHKNQGLRIDLLLASESLAPRCTGAGIDRNARKGEKPSDHAPVWAEFDV